MNKSINGSQMDLTNILNDIWNMLEEGTENSKSDFHLGTICTVDDCTPKSRTVVLRRVDQINNSLIFHTDNRSGKINEINSNPNISWLFYSKQNRIQLRLEGKANIQTKGELFEYQWANSKLMSRKCYLIEDEPGSSLDNHYDYLSQSILSGSPSEEESELGKVNFAVVETMIDSIEWLHLKASGHLRAKFKLNKVHFEGEWLVP